MNELKWVGFIAEEDRSRHAVSYAAFVAQLVDAPAEAVAQAVGFLSRGTVVLALMGFFVDQETGQEVAPKLYYTDGQWIWPSYLAYYLNKRQQLLPGGFCAHTQVPATALPDLRAVQDALLASFDNLTYPA